MPSSSSFRAPWSTGELDFGLPLKAYAALVSGSLLSANGWIDTLVNATPLLLAGLSVAICFKAGLFNIGAQGQTLIGALAAAAAGALLAKEAAPIAIPGALLAGLVAGMIYGFIPGALKAFTGAHEVVTTIMLNYIAIQVIAWAIPGPLLAPGASFARSPDVGNATCPVLLGPTGHHLHAGVLIALAAIPIAWWILNRSTIGFEVRTVGANPDAARYAGMRPASSTLDARSRWWAGGPRRDDRDPRRGGLHAGGLRHEHRLRCDHRRADRAGEPVRRAVRGAAAGRPARGGRVDADPGRHPGRDDRCPPGRDAVLPRRRRHRRRVFRLRRVEGGVDELSTISRSYGGQTTAP